MKLGIFKLNLFSMPIKNYIIILGIILGSLSTAFSQEAKENLYILICGTDQAEFTISDFTKCNMISIRDSEQEVASFVFAVKKKKSFTEVAVQADKLNAVCLELLNKSKEPRTIRIQKVVDKKGSPIKGYRELTITGEI